MSNLDLWYFAGIFITGASVSYIVYEAALFMGLRRKDRDIGSAHSEQSRQTQFLRNSLLAFVGIMLGAQLFQYHRDQTHLAKQEMLKDISMTQAARGAGNPAASPTGLGMRPTTRPPRGQLSISELDKAENRFQQK